MILLFVALMIIFGFVEGRRLDESSPMYRAPAVNAFNGQRSTKVEAWIGRMIGDGLLLFAGMVIISFIINLF